MQTISGKSFARGILCLAAGLLLAACGGGGGSDSPGFSSAPAATVPTQQAAPESAAAAAAPVEPAASAAAGQEASDPTLDAFRKEALDAHNAARAGEGQGLAPLKWSPSLQADTQAWAEQCKLDHWQPKGQGQNLYMTSQSTASPANAVKAWMDEKPDYTYGATGGICAPDKACGHYTQVIWSTTTEVGCAAKTCGNITRRGVDIGPGTVLACNYAPSGNVTGRPPYPAQ